MKKPLISPVDPKTRRRRLRWLYVSLAASLITIQFLALLCAVEQPAYAYVDPGSGLLAFQILGTTFAGIIFMVRKKLRRFFGTKDTKTGENDTGK
jgi:hypothetical protein